MLSYSWENETCPWCGSKGNCVSHGSYTHSMTDFVQGKTVCGELCVLRLRCTSCGHTHAILPDVIIPYAVYGLFFILWVLAEYFSHLYTVEQLCARFGISVSTLYRFRAIFLSQKQIWPGMPVSAQTTPSTFIKGIFLLAQYSASFSCRFVLLTARSFLQSHKNPASRGYDEKNKGGSMSMENNAKQLSSAAAIAQFKPAVTAPAIHGLYPDTSGNAYYKRITQQPLTLPDGSAVCCKPGTLAKRESLCRKGGIDALMPKERSDSGGTRVLTDAAVDEICRLKTEFPRLNATQIHRQLAAGSFIPAAMSVCAVQQFVAGTARFCQLYTN